MRTRRQFLVSLAATGAVAAVAAVPGAAIMPGMTHLPGIVYSESQQGKWEGKAKSHAPQVSVANGKVKVVTGHPMGEGHYIVRHTLVAEDGTVVGAKTFTSADKPESTYELTGRGLFVATSFCNQHDMWVTEFLV